MGEQQPSSPQQQQQQTIKIDPSQLPNLPQFKNLVDSSETTFMRANKRRDFFKTVNGVRIEISEAEQKEIAAKKSEERATLLQSDDWNYSTTGASPRTANEGPRSPRSPRQFNKGKKQALCDDNKNGLSSFYYGFGEADSVMNGNGKLNAAVSPSLKLNFGTAGNSNKNETTENLNDTQEAPSPYFGSPTFGKKNTMSGNKASVAKNPSLCDSTKFFTKEQQWMNYSGQVLRFGLVLKENLNRNNASSGDSNGFAKHGSAKNNTAMKKMNTTSDSFQKGSSKDSFCNSQEENTGNVEHRFFVLSYFLQDDSTEIWELRSDFRPPACFFRRNPDLPGFNVIKDLKNLNQYVEILGRQFLFYKADKFTKCFFANELKRDLEIDVMTGIPIEDMTAEIEENMENEMCMGGNAGANASNNSPRGGGASSPRGGGHNKHSSNSNAEKKNVETTNREALQQRKREQQRLKELGLGEFSDKTIGAREVLCFSVEVMKKEQATRSPRSGARNNNANKSNAENDTQEYGNVMNTISAPISRLLHYNLRTKEIRITTSSSGKNSSLFLKSARYLNTKTGKVFEVEDFACDSEENLILSLNNCSFKVLSSDEFTESYLAEYRGWKKSNGSFLNGCGNTIVNSSATNGLSSTVVGNTSVGNTTSTTTPNITPKIAQNSFTYDLLLTPRSDLDDAKITEIKRQLISKLRKAFAHLRDCFRFFDHDRDGFIDYTDFLYILKHYGYYQLLEAEKQRMFGTFFGESVSANSEQNNGTHSVDGKKKLSFAHFIEVVAEKDYPDNKTKIVEDNF